MERRAAWLTSPRRCAHGPELERIAAVRGVGRCTPWLALLGCAASGQGTKRTAATPVVGWSAAWLRSPGQSPGGSGDMRAAAVAGMGRRATWLASPGRRNPRTGRRVHCGRLLHRTSPATLPRAGCQTRCGRPRCRTARGVACLTRAAPPSCRARRGRARRERVRAVCRVTLAAPPRGGCRARRGRHRRWMSGGVACVTRAVPAQAGCRERRSFHRRGSARWWLASLNRLPRASCREHRGRPGVGRRAAWLMPPGQRPHGPGAEPAAADLDVGRRTAWLAAWFPSPGRHWLGPDDKSTADPTVRVPFAPCFPHRGAAQNHAGAIPQAPSAQHPHVLGMNDVVRARLLLCRTFRVSPPLRGDARYRPGPTPRIPDAPRLPLAWRHVVARV